MALLSLTISGTVLWSGRLAGGEGRLPTLALDVVLRRAALAMGMAAVCSPPATAAVRAAKLGPLLVVTDLRRVTRWLALRAPVRSECERERVRAWAWRPGKPEGEELDSEGRWCVNGLAEGCIS